MKPYAAHQAAVLAERGGSAVAVGGGWWAWLAENQAQIATICAMGGLLVAVVGLVVHWYYARKPLGRRKDD